MPSKEFINDCLKFAYNRLKDFENLNYEKKLLFFRFKRDLAGADRKVREQLFKEFIFHLVTAIDFLAQFVNISRSLNINVEYVNVGNVKEELEKLNPGDPIIPILDIIHPKTRNTTPPKDPYSEEGSHYRILIYRHLVTHRTHNPIKVKMPTRTVHLIFYPNYPNWLLNPNDPNSNSSDKLIIEEMQYFYKLIKEKCEKIIKMV